MKVTIDHMFKPWLCASADDTREVLKQVFLDPKGCMVATDTAMLAVCPCTIEEAPEEFAGLLLPAKALAEFSKKALRVGWGMELIIDLDAKTVMVATKTGNLSVNLMGGQFPNWERVSKRSLEASCEPAEATRPGWMLVNPQLVSTCAEAIGHDKYDRMTPVLVSGGDQYLVLLGKDGESFGIVAPGAASFTAGLRAQAQSALHRFFPEASQEQSPQ